MKGTVLPVNIRLGLKQPKLVNTLAYYDPALIKAEKSYIVLAPVVS